MVVFFKRLSINVLLIIYFKMEKEISIEMRKNLAGFIK